jgi:hypothetical protein
MKKHRSKAFLLLSLFVVYSVIKLFYSVFILTFDRYDPLSACLVYYNNRAHVASVKNFQLVQSYPLSDYPDPAAAQEELVKEDSSLEVMLQLGKVFS